MAVGDVMEVVIGYQNSVRLDKYATVLHFVVNTDDTLATNEVALAAAVDGWVTNNLVAKLNLAASYTGVLCQRVFPLPRTSGRLQQPSGASSGAVTGDCLPPSCALVIKKKCFFAGRRFRGRVFQTLLSESDQINGIWQGANFSAIVAAWGSFLVNLLPSADGGEYSPCIWHKDGVPSQFDIIVDSSGDNVVRQQRRREVGRGS